MTLDAPKPRKSAVTSVEALDGLGLVAGDRAARLAEAGQRAEVRLAFDAAESPRNLAVIASRTR